MTVLNATIPNATAPNSTVLNAVRTTLPPDSEWQPSHPAEVPLLIFVVYGALDVAVDDRMEYLATGDQLYLPAGARHSWRTPVDSGVEMVVITAS
ncbi:cupin domain-containing protein [Crossiella cryophila]|uniref:Quercetin dioxygenase-like cupin family protein n=1 Tax=Crossiella cryophila TaxID=43355 RepID=A0A7W7CH94_9PSEU|nr:cupin domain-containing protein [Crossiella cryophila]MBB4681164.1 quercetin dioxygenase-like cupin family protein [Crossiella cryophila]